MTMKSLAISLIAVASATAQASMVNINFDQIAAGSLASSAAPKGIEFFQAHYLNDVDEYGDEIPNTAKWQIDTLNNAATPVTVENPLANDYGPAPSGSNALDARWQPVLLHFATPSHLQQFSVTLDNSTLGDILPSSLFFLGDHKTILGELSFDQTLPGLTASWTGSLLGVRDIVLPSGAFYDDMTITTVPVPASLPLLLSALGMMVLARSRKGRV